MGLGIYVILRRCGEDSKVALQDANDMFNNAMKFCMLKIIKFLCIHRSRCIVNYNIDRTKRAHQFHACLYFARWEHFSQYGTSSSQHKEKPTFAR